MARVPYLDMADAASSPELAEIFAGIVGLRGSLHNIQRALANQPPALKAFMQMSRYIRHDSSLNPRLRELAILATAYTFDVPYEIYYHVRAARREGVTESQLASFPNWADSDAFDATERAVLSYADQLARRHDVDDATFEELRSRLSLAEITDLAVTVGWYHLCTAIIVPFRIEVEPGEH